MRRLALAILLAGCSRPAPEMQREPLAEADTPATSAAAAGKLRVVDAPADEGAAAALIRTKRLEAKADGRVLVVLVTATWCEPCKRFKAEIASGRLDARLGRTTLLAFDADRDMDRLAAAGYTFHFVPFLALPAPNGEPADRFEAKGEGSEVWRAALPALDRWQAS